MAEGIKAVERAMMSAMTELAIALPTLKRSVTLLQLIIQSDTPSGCSLEEWESIVAEARVILDGDF